MKVHGPSGLYLIKNIASLTNSLILPPVDLISWQRQSASQWQRPELSQLPTGDNNREPATFYYPGLHKSPQKTGLCNISSRPSTWEDSSNFTPQPDNFRRDGDSRWVSDAVRYLQLCSSRKKLQQTCQGDKFNQKADMEGAGLAAALSWTTLMQLQGFSAYSEAWRANWNLEPSCIKSGVTQGLSQTESHHLTVWESRWGNAYRITAGSDVLSANLALRSLP